MNKVEENEIGIDFISQYTVDFTELARDGKLDPVVGRDDEIRRIIHILSRRTKNNPVLIGEPGVGKTAVVEGLAQRIISGDVPISLRGKQILLLDMTSVIAGAKFKGEFEERLKAIIDFILKSNNNIILFIDELHNIVNTGGGGGSIDAGNILKPLLARGELRLIGATTFDEYREYIEKDQALERRFQSLNVDEPSVEDTVAILRGLKERYENFHKVEISDNALVASAYLSNRYITNRKLPDKAIDLLDEAASKLKMQLESTPEDLDILKRDIDKMKMEIFHLRNEKDEASKRTVIKMEEEISSKENLYLGMLKKWSEEKTLIEDIASTNKRFDELKLSSEKLQRNGDLEQASKILYEEMPKLELLLKSLKDKLSSKEQILSTVLSEKEILEVVSSWTKIPLSKINKSDNDKFLHLKETLSKKLIGQENALGLISDSLIRSRARFGNSTKPIGVFLLAGPTGVGKTELAKQLSFALFDSEKSLLRLDMSEYSEPHTISRLIGSPPGYVGYEEGGQLTEKIRRNPFTVILLDEIEKAHPVVDNLLLQIFDDGRLTDGSGREVDFRNSIILLTSNLGHDIHLQSNIDESDKSQLLKNILKDRFTPEFINRLDEVILFDQLTINDLEKIANLHLELLKNKLFDLGIEVEVSDIAIDWIVSRSFDPIYGARPLRRLLEREVETKLSKYLLSDLIKKGSKVYIQAKSELDSELEFVFN